MGPGESKATISMNDNFDETCMRMNYTNQEVKETKTIMENTHLEVGVSTSETRHE